MWVNISKVLAWDPQFGGLAVVQSRNSLAVLRSSNQVFMEVVSDELQPTLTYQARLLQLSILVQESERQKGAGLPKERLSP